MKSVSLFLFLVSLFQLFSFSYPVNPFKIKPSSGKPKLYDPETGEEVDIDSIQMPPHDEQEQPKQKVPDLKNISFHSKYTLLDSKKIPVMGLGLYGVEPGDTTYFTVRNAIAAGYRLFDDHPKEGHSFDDLSAAIIDSGVGRENVFITSKVASNSLGYNGTLKDIEGILKTLGLGYLDLCLLESPIGGKIIETWDALYETHKLGLCRSIGVANFNITHLQAILMNGRRMPVVNQIEMHPLNFQAREDLLNWCTSRAILIQAYGSLLAGHEELMTDEENSYIINGAALNHGKTPAQIFLRWGFQKGFQLIPKTIHEKRMIENQNIFDFQLTADEVEAIGTLSGMLNEYWNPLSASVDLGYVNNSLQFTKDWQKYEKWLKRKSEGGPDLQGLQCSASKTPPTRLK